MYPDTCVYACLVKKNSHDHVRLKPNLREQYIYHSPTMGIQNH